MIDQNQRRTDDVVVEARSFEGFYEATWRSVYRAVAVGVGDYDLAQEAVDEAMVRAYERWSDVRCMDNPDGWVYRVAMNWARTRLRRRRLFFRVPRTSEAYRDPELPDPEVIEAVRQLPLKHREVIVARFVLDMSEADMATALGIAPGTVKSRLHRALATLREALS